MYDTIMDSSTQEGHFVPALLEWMPFDKICDLIKILKQGNTGRVTLGKIKRGWRMTCEKGVENRVPKFVCTQWYYIT